MKKIFDEAIGLLFLVVIFSLGPYVVGYSAAKGAMQAGFQPVTINTVSVEDRR